MAYNKIKYNGVINITPSAGIENIVTINIPSSLNGKLFTLDTLISTYGQASLVECSAVARYMSIYSVDSGGEITQLNTYTICENLLTLVGGQIWVYTETVSTNNVIIQLDTTDWVNNYCLYDVSLEY